jgi:hypothetical protein
MKLKIADLLCKEDKQKLNQAKSPKKKHKHKKKMFRPPIKEEKIDWLDIMGTKNRGLQRGKGGAWR